MTCPNCGGLNPDEARFCGHCGQVLAVVATEPPTLGERAPAPAGLGRSPSFEAATAARGEKAGTWQRVVLGLAAPGAAAGCGLVQMGFPCIGHPSPGAGTCVWVCRGPASPFAFPPTISSLRCGPGPSYGGRCGGLHHLDIVLLPMVLKDLRETNL